MKPSTGPASAIAALAAAVGLASCGGPPADVLDSVMLVEVVQCSAVDHQLATAVVVEADLAATVAHSLGDAESISLRDAAGRRFAAEIVYIDGPRDVALLRLPESAAVPLRLGEPDESGDISIATAAEPDGPILKAGSILDLVSATLDGEGRRAAIKLAADIEPGDSGAAVVDADGRMVGMVFATAREDEIGWAVAASEITAAITTVNGDRPEAVPPAC